MFGQQRSQSGHGLSINTGAANLFSSNNAQQQQQPQSGGLFGSKPGGLFGSSSVAPSAGTLFGATTTSAGGSGLFGATTTAPSQAGTLFGGSALNSQPLQAGGLFSTASTAQPQNSLFGTSTTSQPQTMSLFGGAPSSAPQQSTGLFSAPTSQPQQPSLFGLTTSQAQQSTGLFGPVNPGQNQQGTGLFGSATVQPAQQSTGLFGTSLFNQTQPQNPQQQGNQFGNSAQQKGLFGGSQNTQWPYQHSQYSTLNPAQQTQRSVFSASIGQYTAAQQTVPGVRINLNELRPTTRFNDLYETVQREIEVLDTFILNQINLSGECDNLMPKVAESISYVPNDVDLCTRKLEATERALETDAGAIEFARNLVREDVDAARLSFKAIQGLRLPAHFHSANLWNTAGANAPTTLNAEEDATASADLLSYFMKQSEDMSKKLDGLKKNLGDVESYIMSLESRQATQIQSTRLSQGRDGGVKSADEQVRELATVLKEFEGGILAVAGKVGGAREGLQEVMLGDVHGRRRRH